MKLITKPEQAALTKKTYKAKLKRSEYDAISRVKKRCSFIVDNFEKAKDILLNLVKKNDR